MSIESDSKGELYQYFLAEAPELLQLIEETLFSLIEEKTVEKVHTLMRSAHTLKGSAASVEEETIKTIAHHLEDVFEALYPNELEMDTELSSLLLEGYECLREPLSATIADFAYDENAILQQTAEIFARLQHKLGDFFGREAALPTSEELGFDVVGSIFSDSIIQDLQLLEEAINSQNIEEIEEVLRSQAEFFADLGTSYELPGLTQIAQTTVTAIEQNPEQTIEIAVAALDNFHQARADILEGDRDRGGEVSEYLQKWLTTPTIDLEAEIFDESFFVESVDESSEMTMAFAADIIVSPQVEMTAQSSTEEAILPEIEEPEIFAEIALEEQTEPIKLDVLSQVPPQSPIEEILQSIAVLSVPVSAVDSASEDLENITSTPSKEASKVLPSIKVAIEQLDRLNHTVGELFIKENQQNLHQERLQLLIQETVREFRYCQQEVFRLADWSEQQKRYKRKGANSRTPRRFAAAEINSLATVSSLVKHRQPTTQFDALEMDVYSDLDLKLQTITENISLLGDKLEAIALSVQQTYLHTSKGKQLVERAQNELLQARMQPLSTVLNRFPRHLQQMVASHQKPAKLKIIGAEVNIDKAIAEKLYEPLLHLIRNAYDHGLETPEVRRQQDKTEVGKILIKAYNRGNRTIIEIQDDGKGIDLEKVLTKAIEKNFIEPSQLDSIADSEITDFLFQPGFSTASEVTDLSGRGVGLNVVKSQIKALDGNITIRSQEGLGTTFVLQLPLNLTTARLLLCESQGIVYGLLSTEIKRIIIPTAEQILQQPSLIGDSSEAFWRYQQGDKTELIPICPMSSVVDYSYPIFSRQNSLLDTSIAKKSKTPHKSLLLVEAEGKQLCLQVERVLFEQELIIKSLNSLVLLPDYIQGYSVLSDGNLALVINPIELVAQTYNKSSLEREQSIPFELSQSSLTEMAIATNTKAISFQQPSILVVEDSIVQRQSIVRILEKGGYQVIQAAHGQEAIAHLAQNSPIGLIISDIEMPVMNGFEFLSYCQNHTLFSQIPIMMITTRSGPKHRQLALSLGAKSYMTKPASDRELLQAVAQLVER